jgi:hypothetical protein
MNAIHLFKNHSLNKSSLFVDRIEWYSFNIWMIFIERYSFKNNNLCSFPFLASAYGWFRLEGSSWVCTNLITNYQWSVAGACVFHPPPTHSLPPPIIVNHYHTYLFPPFYSSLISCAFSMPFSTAYMQAPLCQPNAWQRPTAPACADKHFFITYSLPTCTLIRT